MTTPWNTLKDDELSSMSVKAEESVGVAEDDDTVVQISSSPSVVVVSPAKDKPCELLRTKARYRVFSLQRPSWSCPPSQAASSSLEHVHLVLAHGSKGEAFPSEEIDPEEADPENLPLGLAEDDELSSEPCCLVKIRSERDPRLLWMTSEEDNLERKEVEEDPQFEYRPPNDSDSDLYSSISDDESSEPEERFIPSSWPVCVPEKYAHFARSRLGERFPQKMRRLKKPSAPSKSPFKRVVPGAPTGIPPTILSLSVEASSVRGSDVVSLHSDHTLVSGKGTLQGCVQPALTQAIPHQAPVRPVSSATPVEGGGANGQVGGVEPPMAHLLQNKEEGNLGSGAAQPRPMMEDMQVPNSGAWLPAKGVPMPGKGAHFGGKGHMPNMMMPWPAWRGKGGWDVPHKGGGAWGMGYPHYPQPTPQPWAPNMAPINQENIGNPNFKRPSSQMEGGFEGVSGAEPPWRKARGEGEVGPRPIVGGVPGWYPMGKGYHPTYDPSGRMYFPQPRPSLPYAQHPGVPHSYPGSEHSSGGTGYHPSHMLRMPHDPNLVPSPQPVSGAAESEQKKEEEVSVSPADQDLDDDLLGLGNDESTPWAALP